MGREQPGSSSPEEAPTRLTRELLPKQGRGLSQEGAYSPKVRLAPPNLWERGPGGPEQERGATTCVSWAQSPRLPRCAHQQGPAAQHRGCGVGQCRKEAVLPVPVRGARPSLVAIVQ